MIKNLNWCSAFLLSVVLSACSSGGGGGNNTSTAPSGPVGLNPVISINTNNITIPAFSTDISVSKQIALVDEEITFSVAIAENTNPITTYEWTFDDGTTLIGSEVTKAFMVEGIYEAKVTVSDSTGEQEIASTVVNIVPAQAVSVPEFAGSRYGDVNGDGVIDSADVLIVENHINGVSLISDIDSLNAADIDLDQQISNADVALIQQAVDSSWPTSISVTSGIPSTPIMLMLPQLLDLATDIQVELSTGQSLTPQRLLPGYASFTLPLEELTITTGVFEEKDIEIRVLADGAVAHTFSFHVEIPEELSSTPGEVLKQNVELLDEKLVELRANVETLLTNAGATVEERDLILHILQTAEDNILQAQSDYREILNGIDDVTLSFVEKLTVSGKTKLIENVTAATSSNVQKGQQAVGSRALDLPSGCSVSSGLVLMLSVTNARVANSDLIEPIADALSTTCSVISEVSDLFPTLKPSSVACESAAVALTMGSSLIDTITTVLPEMRNNLSLTATPDTVSTDETADISISVGLDNTEFCDASLQSLTSKLTGMIMQKILKKIRQKVSLAIVTKIPLEKRKLFREEVLESVKAITDAMSGSVNHAVDLILGSTRDKFCGAFASLTSTSLDIPSCALNIFQKSGNASRDGILDKTAGTYQAPSFSDCVEGNVTIFAAIRDSNYAGDGTVVIPQTCDLFPGDITVSIEETITSVNVPPTIEVTDEEGNLTHSLYCTPEGSVGEVLSYTERWVYNETDNSITASGVGADNYSVNGSLNPSSLSITLNDTGSPEVSCSGQSNCPDTTYYTAFTWNRAMSFAPSSSPEFTGSGAYITRGTWSYDGRSVTCTANISIRATILSVNSQ